jgi:hypothetical protein
MDFVHNGKPRPHKDSEETLEGADLDEFLVPGEVAPTGQGIVVVLVVVPCWSRSPVSLLPCKNNISYRYDAVFFHFTERNLDFISQIHSLHS